MEAFLCPVHRIPDCSPMLNGCGITNAMKNHLRPIVEMLSDADNAVCLEWIEVSRDGEHKVGKVCGEPADFVVWGHLYEKQAKGPKCSEHLRKHLPDVWDWSISQNAIYDLRPLRRIIGKITT